MESDYIVKKFLVATFILLSVNIALAETLPVSYDLRDYGRVTNIKNQGIPGPCWAFAAIGAMESNYLTQKLNTDGKMPDLSEMQIAFFSYKDSKPERTFTSPHKTGALSLEGNAFMPVALMSRLSGPTDEKNLQYSTQLTYNEKASLAKKSPESFKRSMRLREAFFLSGTSVLDKSSLKKLIMKHGAAVISMYSELGKYHTTDKYYTYYNPDHGTDIDHLVSIIGWDDNFSRNNFIPRPKNDGAWLIRNSWGTTRGNNGGYFWMSYEQHMYGGTVFITERNNSRLKHYGYDDLGWCSNINYSWAANIFKVDGNKERLKEAAFYTSSNNMKYELYIYDLGSKIPASPVSGKLIASKKGSIEYAGYHTVNLTKQIPLTKGSYFSVVLKLSSNSMPVENKSKNYSENALINANESYFSRDGKNWTDGIKIGSNACIKAFTLIR